jgi:hypothetical protein
MNQYTLFDAYAFVDVPKTVFNGIDKTRISFRVKNLTNKLYAQWGDSSYPDQVILGAPRSYEIAASFKWSGIGAGEGNRTLVCSLGSCRSTIELRPRTALGLAHDLVGKPVPTFPDHARPLISRPRAIRQGVPGISCPLLTECKDSRCAGL